MLNLYRRHDPKCNKGNLCQCPIWAYGIMNGKHVRKSLHTRHWEEAAELVRQAKPLPEDANDETRVAKALAAVDSYAGSKDPKVVYVMHHVGQDCVKIGIAANVGIRRAQMQTGSPHPVSVLVETPGGADLERDLHEVFRHSRMEGEWFRLSGAVSKFIVQMCSRKASKTLPKSEVELGANGQEERIEYIHNPISYRNYGGPAQTRTGDLYRVKVDEPPAKVDGSVIP